MTLRAGMPSAVITEIGSRPRIVGFVLLHAVRDVISGRRRCCYHAVVVISVVVIIWAAVIAVSRPETDADGNTRPEAVAVMTIATAVVASAIATAAHDNAATTNTGAGPDRYRAATTPEPAWHAGCDSNTATAAEATAATTDSNAAAATTAAKTATATKAAAATAADSASAATTAAASDAGCLGRTRARRYHRQDECHRCDGTQDF